MHELAYALYAVCVDFMLQLAAILGITYRDANTLVLLLGFPAVTLSLMLAVLVNWRRLRRLARYASSQSANERVRA